MSLYLPIPGIISPPTVHDSSPDVELHRFAERSTHTFVVKAVTALHLSINEFLLKLWFVNTQVTSFLYLSVTSIHAYTHTYVVTCIRRYACLYVCVHVYMYVHSFALLDIYI